MPEERSSRALFERARAPQSHRERHYDRSHDARADEGREEPRPTSAVRRALAGIFGVRARGPVMPSYDSEQAVNLKRLAQEGRPERYVRWRRARHENDRGLGVVF